MPSITEADVERIRDQLFVEGPDSGRRLSRFWMLLVLAAIIATAGVVADSTATVIGAMIVAPLMTPILGIVMAIALGDRANLVRSVALVCSGAAAVVAVGFLIGLLVEVPVDAATSSQVAGRVSPRVIDLVAALATGAVGAFALVRSDISDTLPGVAIAISLVPPLAVVGLTLEAGAGEQSLGALLLFATNVAAILTTGLVVAGVHGVHRLGAAEIHRRHATLVVLALTVLVVVPLVGSTALIARTTQREQRVGQVVQGWADDGGWDVVSVVTEEGVVLVRLLGDGTEPDAAGLRRALDEAGASDVGVRLELVPETTIELPAG